MEPQRRADQTFSFQASTNPERTTAGLFLGCEPQAHPPYSVFNFQELALCILQENWVKCLCGGISAAVCKRDRERERVMERKRILKETILWIE